MSTRRLARGDRIVLATSNRGKRREFERLLSPFGLTLAPLPADYVGPVEDAPDFAGNARLKARAAAAASGLPALADDSGFGIASLGGAPGVHSARYAAGDELGAMARLRDAAARDADRRACFTCVLCLAWPDGREIVATGTVDGSWIWPPEGEGGFGYDPMFRPDGEDRSFAAMTASEKSALSHRGRAFAALAAHWLPDPDPF